MMSHDTNYGYKKILGLMDKDKDKDKDKEKRSLEARADAFSRLKIESLTWDHRLLWTSFFSLYL